MLYIVYGATAHFCWVLQHSRSHSQSSAGHTHSHSRPQPPTPHLVYMYVGIGRERWDGKRGRGVGGNIREHERGGGDTSRWYHYRRSSHTQSCIMKGTKVLTLGAGR